MKYQKKCVLSWSGGKDSALAYYEMKRLGELSVSGLMTTLTQDYDRISMHGVRRDLLLAQSRELELPLYEVLIPKHASNEIYESNTQTKLLEAKQKYGVSRVVFGDLFLQDIRDYREKFLEKLGFECIFPVWGRDTTELANYFVESGFRAIICCVDPQKIAKEICGREFDKEFLLELPKEVDPCGENGEFHTFVYDGPIFKSEIKVNVGEIVERDHFCFADIRPIT
ncbi:MAG: diphthine--ammonia ligase [Nitrososphaerales archaeon]